MPSGSTQPTQTTTKRKYKATIYGDKYPFEFVVEASSWSVAARRATELWMKRFKGSRTDSLKIHLVRSVS